MIRPLLSAALSLFLFVALYAQDTCAPTAYDVINANEVRAHVSNGGDLFNNSGSDPGFSVPYVAGAPEVHTLFTTGLLLAGLDPAGNLRLAQVGFRSGPGGTDYRPGPLDAVTGEVIPGACQDFDRIWATNRTDILQLRADFEADGTVDDPIPASLRQWPARGNPYFLDEFGFELPAQSLAPFYDENQDGDYDPADGDYPVLNSDDPEGIPDEMLWTVFNDAAAPHEFPTDSLNVEVQLLVFAFNCAENELLNRTVFTRHRIINRSSTALNDLRLGLFVDPDVGCYTDDHLGVDSTLSTVYFYNADATDGNGSCVCTGGVNTYCQAPPAQTLTFLSEPMSSFIYHGSPGNPGIPPAMTTPENPVQMYNVLSGRWRSGEPITQGGTGYNPGSTDTTLFVFHGPPDDQGWSMQNETLDPVDYRAIPAFRLDQFLPNQILEFDMAHAFHQYPDVDYYGQVAAALERIPDLQTLHDNGYATPCQQSALCTVDCVWPGDANNSGIVEPFDGLAIGLAAGNDATGPERPLASPQWRGQDAEDWAGSGTDGVNYKHADANGDGAVNRLDGAVFDLNYGQQRPGATTPPDIPATDGDYALHLTHNRSQVDAGDDLPLQRLVRTTVTLGSEEEPVQDIYGIAFTIRYDPDLMEVAEGLPFPLVDLPGSTFFGQTSALIGYAYGNPGPGRLDIVFSRTDGQNVSGYGPLADFFLVLRDDALTGNPDGTADIVYEVVNVRAVNAAGEELLVGAEVDTIQGINLTYDPTLSTRDPLATHQLRLFPNPTRGELNVELPTGWQGAFQLELFDATGRQVWSREERAAGPVLTTNLPEELPEGLYFVKLRGAEGQVATGKLIHR